MAQEVLDQLMPHVHDLNDACLRFAVIVDGRQWTVEVPLSRFQIAFERAGRALGCRIPRSLGARHRSVGGFFGSLKRMYKKATRSVKHMLPKVAQHAIRKVENTANTAAKYAWKAHRIAKDIVTSDAFAAGLVGASFLVPALAPVAATAIAARTMIKQIDAGKRAAEAVARGVQKTPAIVAALTQGQRAKTQAETMVTSARQGSQVAQQFMGALRQLR